MSGEPWSLLFTRRADKDMERLDRTVQVRVGRALGDLANDPSTARLRKLTSRRESRLRVGDWRILLELDAATRTILVRRVLPRGRAYDR